MDSSLKPRWPGYSEQYCNWRPTGGNNRQYKLGNNYAVPGDWITLEPGVPLDMEVVIGEVPGGHYDAMLCVEVDGVDYPRNSQPGPIFPMFKTTEPNHDLRDSIYEWLVPGEASITNGPVFCDFSPGGKVTPRESTIPVEPSPQPEQESMRPWSLESGKVVEAEYINVIGDKLILKTAKGKQVKLPLNQISQEDKEFIELSNPPKFKLDFIKTSTSVLNRYKMSPKEMEWGRDSVRVNDYTFGAKVKQTGAGQYNHELNVEYFAIGQQYLDDRKYILLDKGSQSFTPTKENQRSLEFTSEKPIETTSYTMHDQLRGKKSKGYLIFIRDKQGEIIQHAASPDWLYDIHEDLEKLPIGRFFDKTGKRVHPTGPKKYY